MVSRGLFLYGYSGEALWSIPSIYVSTDMKGQVCSSEFEVSKAVSNHMVYAALKHHMGSQLVRIVSAIHEGR